MNIDQANQIIDKVLASLQLNRQDHAVLQQALQLLYAKAMDNDEIKKEYGLQELDNVGTNGKIVPIRPTS